MNRSRIAVAAVLVTIAGAAQAAPLARGASAAQLAAPLPSAREVLIDGRFWRCAADSCSAAPQDGADSQPLWMECSHVAETFGAVAAYQTGEQVLDAGRLARCNTHAKGAPRS